MSNFQAISKSLHAGKRAMRHAHYAFAGRDTVASLAQQEWAQAGMHMPLAFMQKGQGLHAVALQGFLPGKNLWLGADGRWQGGYIPATYRSYPFALLPGDDGRLLLCIDVDSGLFSDTEGEPLFDAFGEPTQVVKEVLGFLEHITRGQRAMQAVVRRLEQHQLLRPWALKVQDDEGEKTIEGLFRIDEAALNGLDAAALKSLQLGGALAVAYMQLLSMQHLDKLVQRARAHAAATASAAAMSLQSKAELDLEFLNGGGTLQFSRF